MIKTIAYTDAYTDTVVRGTQCWIVGSLYSALCWLWAQSPWRSISQSLPLAAAADVPRRFRAEKSWGTVDGR